jgi:hypothetical protein
MMWIKIFPAKTRRRKGAEKKTKKRVLTQGEEREKKFFEKK